MTHSRNLEMELGEKPKPGGFIAKSGREEGGAVEPGKVESGNGNVSGLRGAERAEGSGEPAGVVPRGGETVAPAARAQEGASRTVLPGGNGNVRSAAPVSELAPDEGARNHPAVGAEAAVPGGEGASRGGENQATEKKPRLHFGGPRKPTSPPNRKRAKALESARGRISNSDLAGKGKEIGDGGNHVTVRYGIQGEDTEGVKKFLSAQAPFEAALGKTEKFPVSEHSEGAAPIVAPIVAPELHRLNAELEKHGDFAEPSFKEYKPHATVAYVDPEKADRYVGMDVTEGKKFTVSEIAISKKDGSQEMVKLEGEEGAAPGIVESEAGSSQNRNSQAG